jgi:hypothetical protein
MRAGRHAAVARTAVLASACADSVVVNSGESPPSTATTASATPTGRTDPNLVNGHDFYVTADDLKGYYFTTPSGKWSCAILPHSKAGCQAAAGAQEMSIPGEPDTVFGADGQPVAPNAIAVADEEVAGFTWLPRPGFSTKSDQPLILDFGKPLAAAGFRCNVQQDRVSCMNETTKNGFTFSATGYSLRYTPVPG